MAVTAPRLALQPNGPGPFHMPQDDRRGSSVAGSRATGAVKARSSLHADVRRSNGPMTAIVRAVMKQVD